MFELIVGIAVGAGLGNTGRWKRPPSLKAPAGAYFPSKIQPCFEPFVNESKKIMTTLRDKIVMAKEELSSGPGVTAAMAPKDRGTGRPSQSPVLIAHPAASS